MKITGTRNLIYTSALKFTPPICIRYVRCLGAFYLRLVGTPVDIYNYLEPLYNDFRRIKVRKPAGDFVISHVDEFIDQLLTEERVCDIILPRLMKRSVRALTCCLKFSSFLTVCF